jgi:serine/threonine protein kinase
VERSLIIEAIGHAARKRRLLDADQVSRLTDVLRSRGLDSAERLRGWLASANGMSVALARELLKIMARSDQPSFGAYQPIAHLANGGMGSVWLASNRSRDGLVVVKAMRKDVAENEEFQKRFARETRIMMETEDPGVVRCLDTGKTSDDSLFMVLEFVEGGDLKDLAENRGVPEAMALQIIFQITGALNAAHSRQLVHRDIKPANIFAYPDGRAKLADFGIARSTSESRTRLTMMGALVGSPPNMSPEQVIGDDHLDIRSDIYSLGTVLYFALTGKDCFTGRLQEVLHAQRNSPVPDARKIKPDITQATIDIIAKCMQKKREDRYQTPSILAEAVASALKALGQVPGSLANQSALPPNALVAATAQDREMTETMLARLVSNDSTKKGDSSVILGQKTPTGFPSPTPFRVPPADDPRELGTVVAPQTPIPGEVFTGDITTALTGSWLTLVGDDPNRLIMLYAKGRLDMGKLREPPIDICLRNYPLTEQREACLRVSRHHLDLIFDPARSALLLVDAGSGNGSVVDGAVLPPNQPLTLASERDFNVVVARAIQLRFRCIPRKSGRLTQLTGAPAASGNASCGLETEHLFDAVSITRPANRPEMAYAMVLRRISVGGPGSDLLVNGATSTAFSDIALFDGRWIYRLPQAGSPWQPITNGAALQCGGFRFSARPGSYEDF